MNTWTCCIINVWMSPSVPDMFEFEVKVLNPNAPSIDLSSVPCSTICLRWPGDRRPVRLPSDQADNRMPKTKILSFHWEVTVRGVSPKSWESNHPKLRNPISSSCLGDMRCLAKIDFRELFILTFWVTGDERARVNLTPILVNGNISLVCQSPIDWKAAFSGDEDSRPNWIHHPWSLVLQKNPPKHRR